MVSYHLDRKARVFRMMINPSITTFAEGFRFSLYHLLGGFPAKVIQRCKECKKLFLNFTMRKKYFCSNKCLWKFNAEKARNKDPEAYRKKQAEIMRKRYATKMKAKGYKKINHYRKGGK